MKTKWYDIVIGIFLFLLLVWHFSGCPYTLDFSRDTGMYLPSRTGLEVDKPHESGNEDGLLESEPSSKPTEPKPKPTQTPTPTQPTTPIEKLAWEVIEGRWGAGLEREQLLTDAGHDYEAVQDRVNEICSTIRGGSLVFSWE